MKISNIVIPRKLAVPNSWNSLTSGLVFCYFPLNSRSWNFQTREFEFWFKTLASNGVQFLKRMKGFQHQSEWRCNILTNAWIGAIWNISSWNIKHFHIVIIISVFSNVSNNLVDLSVTYQFEFLLNNNLKNEVRKLLFPKRGSFGKILVPFPPLLHKLAPKFGASNLQSFF